MTMPPGTPGPPADPRDPAAAQGPSQQSFQYRPHDPYGAFAGQPSGPVLPPPPTWAQRWGILPKDDRPRQVTVILQALWIHLAVNALAVLIALGAALVAALAFSFMGLFGGIVFGLVVAAVNLALIWAVAREQLGRFGFQDPRMVFYIGLGVMGLNAVCGAFSVIRFLPSILELAALALCLVLLYTRPVRAWLRDRPGNWPRKVPDQHPDARPAEPAPPVWRDAGPGPAAAPPVQPPPPGPPSTTPPPPAPGTPPPAAPPGWPQPPR